jgi:hypothetical protein
MFRLSTFSWIGRLLFPVFAASLIAAQNTAPAGNPPALAKSPNSAATQNTAAFNKLVDSAIQQERTLAMLMRNFKPIVETYIQEEKSDPEVGASPRSDSYFLSRLDLTGKVPTTVAFEDPERAEDRWEKKFLFRNPQRFTASGFAQALFPDLDHFDRQNYEFEFVRWEVLGDIRCGVVDVKPRANSENRGFIGRIWVEDQNFNIVRFTGSYGSKQLSRRAFHFDSWRLNILGVTWMPAYIYTQESASQDTANHDLWFKAQTRVWGYDLQHAGDHREYAKPLTDTPVWIDPKRQEASQNLSPAYTLGKSAYTPEDNVVERLQVAGLMAPDGEVDQILQTVVNNLLLTNDLDVAGVRCRVLLTTPLESFVVGRTIIVSRGLLDVLPDEATLASVLAHELAHVVLQHSVADAPLSDRTPPFSDLEIFDHLSFRFDPAQEDAAEKKGLQLFSKSPYQAQREKASLFLDTLEARSRQLSSLLRGRFSNDFASNHLASMRAEGTAPKPLQMDRVDQISALPLGSRITVDPWSDRIVMIKAPPVRLQSASEKMPLEVTPFFPFLKRRDEHEKAQAGPQP